MNTQKVHRKPIVYEAVQLDDCGRYALVVWLRSSGLQAVATSSPEGILFEDEDGDTVLVCIGDWVVRSYSDYKRKHEVFDDAYYHQEFIPVPPTPRHWWSKG